MIFDSEKNYSAGRKKNQTKVDDSTDTTHKCSYCGKAFATHDLTFDHVNPRSRGGQTAWENIATACRECNEKKGDRTPREAGMPLLVKPRCPHRIPHLMSRMQIEDIPDEWENYLWNLKKE